MMGVVDGRLDRRIKRSSFLSSRILGFLKKSCEFFIWMGFLSASLPFGDGRHLQSKIIKNSNGYPLQNPAICTLGGVRFYTENTSTKMVISHLTLSSLSGTLKLRNSRKKIWFVYE